MYTTQSNRVVLRCSSNSGLPMQLQIKFKQQRVIFASRWYTSELTYVRECPCLRCIIKITETTIYTEPDFVWIFDSPEAYCSYSDVLRTFAHGESYVQQQHMCYTYTHWCTTIFISKHRGVSHPYPNNLNFGVCFGWEMQRRTRICVPTLCDVRRVAFDMDLFGWQLFGQKEQHDRTSHERTNTRRIRFILYDTWATQI